MTDIDEVMISSLTAILECCSEEQVLDVAEAKDVYVWVDPHLCSVVSMVRMSDQFAVVGLSIDRDQNHTSIATTLMDHLVQLQKIYKHVDVHIWFDATLAQHLVDMCYEQVHRHIKSDKLHWMKSMLGQKDLIGIKPTKGSKLRASALFRRVQSNHQIWRTYNCMFMRRGDQTNTELWNRDVPRYNTNIEHQHIIDRPYLLMALLMDQFVTHDEDVANIS